MWFSVVCTLIDNEYASSQWSKFVAQPSESTTLVVAIVVKHNFDVDVTSACRFWEFIGRQSIVTNYGQSRY